MEANCNSKGTIKQTKWGISLLRGWLSENGESPDFENLSVENLDNILRRFYASLRTGSGDLYSKSAFVGIRAAINRHLRSPPYNRKISLLDGNDFVKSNNMFKAMLKKMKKEGFDRTKHHDAISDHDLQKLRSSNTLSISNPTSLQRKVWFDITLSFARRGRENMREMSASAFAFKHDDSGCEYVEMAFNESTKNHPGDLIKDRDFEARPRMYGNTTSTCPVTSLRLYLQKRNKSNDIFFQQPKRNVSESDAEWYTSRPVGEKTLNNMMKTISSEAGLSKSYTNHCVRATTVTVLSHAGVEAREIMRISGHRTEQSIKSYNTDSSEEQKRKYSNILHGVASGDASAMVPVSSGDATLPHNSHSLDDVNARMPNQAPHSSQITNSTMNIQQNMPLNYQYHKQFDVYNSSVQIYNFFGNN